MVYWCAGYGGKSLVFHLYGCSKSCSHMKKSIGLLILGIGWSFIYMIEWISTRGKILSCKWFNVSPFSTKHMLESESNHIYKIDTQRRPRQHQIENHHVGTVTWQWLVSQLLVHIMDSVNRRGRSLFILLKISSKGNTVIAQYLKRRRNFKSQQPSSWLFIQEPT